MEGGGKACMASAPTMTASVLLVVVVVVDDVGSPQQHLGWFLSIMIFKATPLAEEEPSLRHLMLPPPAAAAATPSAQSCLLRAKDNCILSSLF